MKTSVSLIIGLGFVLFVGGLAEASETAFTYQGRLESSEVAAEGRFDFTFMLYDSAEKGKILAPSVNCENVEVVGGYFSVEIDFGADPSVFNGKVRYLAIGVQRTGMEAPAYLLSPRQKVTLTPYARKAFSAQEVRRVEHISDYVVRVDIGEMESQYFHYFGRINSESQIILYRDGTSNTAMKLAGRSSVGDVELVRFASDNGFMREWMERVMENENFKRNVMIYLFDREGHAIDAWELTKVWPSRLYYETDENFATVVEKTVLVAEEIDRIHIDESVIAVDRWYPGQQPVVRLPLLVEVVENPLREFDEMKGLGWDVQVIEYQEAQELIIYKIPGEISVMNLELGREVQNGDSHLWDWRRDLLSGGMGKKDVFVIMLNQVYLEELSFSLASAWPAELGVSFDAAKNRMEERLVIAADSLH